MLSVKFKNQSYLFLYPKILYLILTVGLTYNGHRVIASMVKKFSDLFSFIQ